MATKLRKNVSDIGPSKSDAENIHVQMKTTVHSKRKANDPSPHDKEEEIVFDRPRKRRKSEQIKHKKTKTSHRSKSKSLPTQQRLSFKPLQSSLASARGALRELSPRQSGNRQPGLIAYVQLPSYDEQFRAQFSTRAPFSTTASFPPAQSRSQFPAGETLHEEEAQAPTTFNTTATSSGRPKRQSALTSYNFATLFESDSEDELSVAPKTNTRTVQRRQLPEMPSDVDSDDDFTMDDVPVGAGSSETEDSKANNESDAAENDSDDNDEEEDLSVISDEGEDSEGQTTQVKGKTKKGSAAPVKNLERMFTRPRGEPKGLDTRLPPISEVDEIFTDLTTRALRQGLEKAVGHLRGRPLRVATMCSGTESPLLALQMINEALRHLLPSAQIEIQHLFSAEIVPYKQAYIERNFAPPIIFRDITELTKAVHDAVPMATTAYGAKVPIPQDVDIVIAGTSCVDFSNLNSRKKNLEDGGESGETWKAVLSFCKAFRPSIVLLENVLKAKWSKMIPDYEKIGYDSCGVLVDTKDYYLPQTRQRGYMACFDRAKSTSAGVRNATTSWQSYMNTLKRYASSPASDFLLPNDQIVRQQIRTDEPTREKSWSQCRMRHIAYRQSHGLGTSRPVTNWSESGAMQPPDCGDQAWYAKQVPRVLDLIDGATLRKALPINGMYDVWYKTRLWDLSQNIDREGDHRHFGIQGCITPSGQPFVTDAGRRMAPIELLRQQGIPLDKISFTTETPAEIQDLAGNAMSSTVIGSSILAALMSCYKVFDVQKAGNQSLQSATSNANPQSARGNVRRHTLSSAAEEIDMENLSARTERALRRCYCEGARGQASRSLQECASCGHTTCTVCGGNPEHNYRPAIVLSGARLSPVAFENELRSRVPLRLSFTALSSSLLDTLGKEDSAYRRLVVSALKSTYSFQRIRRTSCWTVVYTSEGAEADLLLVLGQGDPEWRIFVRAPKSLARKHRLRTLLQQPVARSTAALSLLDTSWELRSPTIVQRDIDITGSGARIASWWCRHGMPAFSEHYVHEYLNIKLDGCQADPVAQLLTGRYQYLPKCGTASSGLFRKIQPNPARPIFLFLDPTRIDDPKKDCFVFAYDINRKEYDEVRDVLARVAPEWRPWPVPNNEGILETPATKTSLSADSWRPVPELRGLVTPDYQLQFGRPANVKELAQSLDCSQAAVLLSCDTQLGSLGEHQNKPFAERHPWILESMRRQLPWDQWMSINHETIDCACQICVPARPALRWSLNDSDDIVPYEDPETAATYERAIKSRPAAFAISARNHGGYLTLDLIANVVSLAERAGAKLGTTSGIVYNWRLTGGGTKQQQPFVFRSFKLKPTTGVEPYQHNLDMSVKLFPKQKLALAWMRNQERGVPFTLEHIEEASILTLNWRTEIRAQTNVNIRGGICADHPGFGKTITSLALICSHFRERSQSDIVIDLTERQRAAAPGLIPIAATLVICPHSLVRQWVEETIDKLGYRVGNEIMSIRTLADLSKTTIASFRSAKVIFVNRGLFSNEAYTERLAAFAAIPGPATKSGRSFAQWLKFAANQIPSHLDKLQTQSAASFRHHLETKYREHLSSERFTRMLPSRRLRGANYVAGKNQKRAAAAVNLKAASSLDTANIRVPLFEQFYFNRLIVDEFHQYESKEYAAITALKADKRWGLSGTPALGDFYDVAHIGGLLGVPLRLGSDAKGVMKTKNAKEMKKDMTNFELFDMMRQLPSDATYSSIYEHDQVFLDTFVRQNLMDFDDLVFHEHLMPVRLDTHHYALYFELCQQLASTDMRMRKSSKGKSKKKEDMEVDFRKASSAVEASETAEEALSRFATAYDESYRNAEADIEVKKERVLADLPQAIADARGNEREHFDQFNESELDNGSLGDATTIAQVSKILRQLSELRARPKTSKSAGKRANTSALNDMCKRLVELTRAQRYLQNIRQLQTASRKGKAVQACDFPDCDEHASRSPDVAVSASCGHFVCRMCYDKLRHQNKTTCQAAGCNSSMNDFQLLWTNKMMPVDAPEPEPYGAKVEAAVRLLQKIQASGDQAILFVQYESQLDHVAAALQAHRLPAIVVKDSINAGQQIADFRDSNGKADQKLVIVLNASSETAAGSNLQCANHVIFLSPLLRDSQYGYESTMAQAIGRVRRHGQKKEIHVYRIVALDTIDVDILEHRERRTEAMTEEAARTIKPPPAARRLNMDARPKPEKTQLVCENGRFSLRPRSWLVKCGADEGDADENAKVMGRDRVLGWEDFSSLVKFSNAFTENDE